MNVFFIQGITKFPKSVIYCYVIFSSIITVSVFCWNSQNMLNDKNGIIDSFNILVFWLAGTTHSNWFNIHISIIYYLSIYPFEDCDFVIVFSNKAK